MVVVVSGESHQRFLTMAVIMSVGAGPRRDGFVTLIRLAVGRETHFDGPAHSSRPQRLRALEFGMRTQAVTRGQAGAYDRILD
jgi:hypothetical protein